MLRVVGLSDTGQSESRRWSRTPLVAATSTAIKHSEINRPKAADGGLACLAAQYLQLCEQTLQSWPLIV